MKNSFFVFNKKMLNTNNLLNSNNLLNKNIFKTNIYYSVYVFIYLIPILLLLNGYLLFNLEYDKLTFILNICFTSLKIGLNVYFIILSRTILNTLNLSINKNIYYHFISSINNIININYVSLEYKYYRSILYKIKYELVIKILNFIFGIFITFIFSFVILNIYDSYHYKIICFIYFIVIYVLSFPIMYYFNTLKYLKVILLNFKLNFDSKYIYLNWYELLNPFIKCNKLLENYLDDTYDYILIFKKLFKKYMYYLHILNMIILSLTFVEILIIISFNKNITLLMLVYCLIKLFLVYINIAYLDYQYMKHLKIYCLNNLAYVIKYNKLNIDNFSIFINDSLDIK